jgi:hypothetical protein
MVPSWVATVFDLDGRGAITLTVNRVTTAVAARRPPADALAGRSMAAAALGDLPTKTAAGATTRLRDRHGVTTLFAALGAMPLSQS